MVSDRNLVGKSVRACDNCARKRGRWYCAADDAFLCEPCDSSVHTANPLARRHERVRLKIASDDESEADRGFKDCVPSWHEGFTRKARTPRQKKHGKLRVVPEPEVCSEEESEEQLLYRVPVFEAAAKTSAENQSKADEAASMDHFYLPSELDLADFAADVESLLGKGLDDEAFDMKGLGILECDDVMQERKWRIIKDEDGEANPQTDVGREIFELNLGYASPFTYYEDEEENKTENQELISRSECKVEDSNKALLKLDYERVISAWDDTKSPWTTGEKPEFSSGGWLPDCCLGTSGTMHAYGDMGMRSGQAAAPASDGGREARVSRYREKRRTRLFSKKIRYEVRKLNAEKRPRMKGRFVKRASFAASAFPLLNK